MERSSDGESCYTPGLVRVRRCVLSAWCDARFKLQRSLQTIWRLGCDTLSEGRSTLSFNEEYICQRRIPPYDFNLGIDNTRSLCKLHCPPE